MPFTNKLLRPPNGFSLKKHILAIVATCTFVSHSTMASDAVTLSDAIKLTLANHPELTSYQFKQNMASGVIEQSKQVSPLSIELSIEDALGTGSYSGLSSLQTSLSISWLMEEDLAQARLNVANQQYQSIEVEKKINQLDVAADTARIFITILSQQQQLKLAKLSHQQASAMLNDIEKRNNIGQLSEVDKFRAQADLVQKSLLVEDLEHEIIASKAQLSAQWQQQQENISVVGNLQQIPQVKSLASIKQQLSDNPALLILANKQRIAQAQIKQAKQSALPAWQFSAGIKRNEAVDDFGVIAGVSIPFGTKPRNTGEIRKLGAQQQLFESQATAWYQAKATELLLLTHKLGHFQHVVEGLSQKSIPALEKALSAAKQAYLAGSYRYSDWYSIQQELTAAQQELILAYTNIHLFNIDIERLTGAAISDI